MFHMALCSQVSLKCVIYALTYIYIIYIYVRIYVLARLTIILLLRKNTVAISLLQVKYC